MAQYVWAIFSKTLNGDTLPSLWSKRVDIPGEVWTRCTEATVMAVLVSSVTTPRLGVHVTTDGTVYFWAAKGLPATDGERHTLYKSTDNGATWTLIQNGFTDTLRYNLKQLVSCPRDPLKLVGLFTHYATGTMAVYTRYSVDGGATWSTPLAATDTYDDDVEVRWEKVGATAHRLYLWAKSSSVSATVGRLIYSNDGGASWTIVTRTAKIVATSTYLRYGSICQTADSSKIGLIAGGNAGTPVLVEFDISTGKCTGEVTAGDGNHTNYLPATCTTAYNLFHVGTKWVIAETTQPRIWDGVHATGIPASGDWHEGATTSNSHRSVAISADDQDVIYAVSAQTNLTAGPWKTADGGTTWADDDPGTGMQYCSYQDSAHRAGISVSGSATVATGPSLGKSIYPDTVTPGEVARLTITLVNPNPWPMTLTSALVDTLPSGLVVADTPDAQTTCGNATVTATKGASTITLSSGATVPAASTATVSVNVVSATAGYRLNTLAIGALVTNFGSNAAAVSCTLAVIPAPANPPTVSKRFEPNVIVAGGTSRLIITLVNPNTAIAELSATFTDTLPTGVLIATVPNAALERLTGTLTTGSDSITLGADGEVPIGAGVNHLSRNGTISVDVTAAAAGVYVDTIPIGALATTVGGAPMSNIGAASATLTVMAAPYIEADDHFTLCFDVANKAWHHWDAPRTQGHYFDTVNKIMRAWGGLTCGHVHQRGGSVAPAVYFALAGMENPDRLKRFRHVELDLTGDVADWTCEFYIDGASAGTVTKAVPNRGWWRYGVAIASYIAAYGTAITTGQYGPPRRQTLRFPCPTGGRGRVMGFILRSALHAGFLRIHAVTPNTAEV